MPNELRCAFCERAIPVQRLAIEVRFPHLDPDKTHWLHRMCTVPFLKQHPLRPSRS